MKTKALRRTLVALLALTMALPAFSQTGLEDGSKYGKGQDSINCIKNLSLYREFFKHSNYSDAIGPWKQVFGECPASSEKMYVEGVTMYRKFIAEVQSDARKDELVDTLMLIYERRMEYFGGEGNVKGRQGLDLLRFESGKIESVQEANGLLKESVMLSGAKQRDVVLINLMNTSISLNQNGIIDDGAAIEDYFMVAENIDMMMEKSSSSRWPKAKNQVDESMLNSGLLTCDALNTYFEPQFDAGKEDMEFLKKVVKFYESSGCDRADLYVAASEQMYAIDPGPESAHQLANLFIIKSDYSKASRYLKEAVAAEDVENETRAEWYYKLAVVSSAQKLPCEAITYARKAIDLKSDYGKAYLLLGDAIIASRSNLGDDFEQRTAFWVAADKYARAKAVEPEVSADANKKINDYKAHYPNHEDVFFRDLKDGDSYRVKGCINEVTTVRSRKN